MEKCLLVQTYGESDTLVSYVGLVSHYYNPEAVMEVDPEHPEDAMMEKSIENSVDMVRYIYIYIFF